MMDKKEKGYLIAFFCSLIVLALIAVISFIYAAGKIYQEGSMVGECWADEAIVNSYYASSCNSFFRFGTATGGAMNIVSLVKGYTRSEYFAESLENNEAQMHKANAEVYSSYFLSNHDQDRVSKNFTTPETYKAACSLYALLPGTSYTYYGEEIALIGVRTTGSTTDDLSDVKRRLPMIWSSSDKTGECKFPETNRPELNTTVQVKIGVAEQLATPFSLLNHYKMMIHLRNKYSFIKNAILTSAVAKLATSERSVLAYTLTSGSDSITIVHNFASHNVEVSAPATKILEQINTTHRLPELANGKLKLGAFSSVIMYYDKSVITDATHLTSMESLIADCEAAGKKWSFEMETSAWYLASFFFGTGCHSNWTTDSSGKFTAVDDTFDSDKGIIAARAMIAGLEDISEGTITIDGQVVNDLQPKDRHISMVFQNYALYPHLTVFENIAFPLRLMASKPSSTGSRPGYRFPAWNGPRKPVKPTPTNWKNPPITNGRINASSITRETRRQPSTNSKFKSMPRTRSFGGVFFDEKKRPLRIAYVVETFYLVTCG